MTNGPSRRALLGFLAAAPFIVKAAGLMPVKAVLGLPPAPRILTLEDWAYLEGMAQEIAQTMFYGDTGIMPVHFVGLAFDGERLHTPAASPDAIWRNVS